MPSPTLPFRRLFALGSLRRIRSVLPLLALIPMGSLWAEESGTLVPPPRVPMELERVAKLGPGPGKENSGIVQSRRRPGVFWMHNDSGDEPRLYPIGRDGRDLGTTDAGRPAGVLVAGAVNVDWEDLTADGEGNLIVADVGNNPNDRRDLTLYVVPEPAPGARRTTWLRKYLVRYPDQTAFPAPADDFNFDCEAVFTVGTEIHLLTKHRSDTRATLYRLAEPREGVVNTLVREGEFDFQGQAVAADASPDGLRLVVATYKALWLFQREDRETPFFAGRISWLPYESPQVEAVCFAEEGCLLLADERRGELYEVLLGDFTPLREALGHAPAPTAAQLAEIAPGAWTLVIFPDTQYYVDQTRRIPPTPEVFHAMTEWVAAQREARRIGLVLHVGDIVDNDTEVEWRLAREAWRPLDGHLPYVMALGNHDYFQTATRRETGYNEHFRIADNPLNDPARGGIFRESMQPGRLENSAHEFTAPDGRRFLVLALEWGVTDAAVAWANAVLERPEYQRHIAIVVLHAYLNHDDTLLDHAAKPQSQTGNPLSYGTAQTGDSNDGRMLWRKLIRRHPQIQLVCCGHITGSPEERMMLGDRTEVGYRQSRGEHGNIVHQMLFNAQRQGDAGEGWLRLLEFQPDGRTVLVKTYSPWLDQRKLTSWRSDEDDYFSFELTPPAE